jgi:malonate-semialdehyde dehydrogenase (acetylating)/methylmalonate-semialdehyde dehydrogenase
MQEEHVRTIEHWIDGKIASGAGTATSAVFNPATGAQQAQVILGTSREVDAAVAAAARAFVDWGQSSISRRASSTDCPHV